MEIEDCAYPLVDSVMGTADYAQAFKNVDYCILVGGFPRRKGMLRSDLLAKNGPIFKATGEALEAYASKDVKVLVVANPANTNCLTCATYAPSIPKENFCALTRLDQNRAMGQIANRTKSAVRNVNGVIIWGNHSKSQVPDASTATVQGDDEKEAVSATSAISDGWLTTDGEGFFRHTVQYRGAAVIKARGLSSAMSAANAAKDCVRDWHFGTQSGKHVAMSVYSNGNPYGVAEGIFYSFPVTVSGGKWTIVKDVKIDDKTAALMKASADELLAEKEEAGLGGNSKL